MARGRAARRATDAPAGALTLVFLYRKVLGLDLPWLAEIGRPQAARRLPVVLSSAEIAALLAAFESSRHRLFASFSTAPACV